MSPASRPPSSNRDAETPRISSRDPDQRAASRQARRIDPLGPSLARAAALLERAEDDTWPLERRLRMLALSARCLDTAFESDAAPRDDQSRTAPTAGRLVERQEALLFDRLLPALAERGLEIGRWADLDGGAQRQLTEVFDQTIFPVLTPLRLGPAHPALQLGSLDLQVGVTADDEETGERFFARVALPDFLPRVVEVSGHRRAFVAVEEIVKNQVDRLFPGASIDSRGAFRVTRSRRLGGIVPDHGGAGLLAPRGDAVRLECDAGLSDDALRLLLQALSLGEDAVYARRLPLDLGTADHLASAVARA